MRRPARHLIGAAALVGSAVAALALGGAAAGPGAPQLAFPLACRIGQTCEVQHYVDRDPGPGVLDYRCGHRTYQGHDGIDIRVLDLAAQQRGVAVLAAAAGRVSRLRDGVADISIRTPGAPSVAGQECGNGVVIDHGQGWETQYCHLAQGSIAVKVGQAVTAGQAIARVGLSGDTEFPHLHLTVRHGTAKVDPFAGEVAPPGSCKASGGGDSLWTPAAREQLFYKAGAVLNAGFAAGPVTGPDVERGGASPGREAAALVAYVRAIGLAAGDRQELELDAPDGSVLAKTAIAPLDRDKDEYLTFVGKKRPAAGWATGTYRARYRVLRDGAVALSRDFSLALSPAS